MTISNEAVEAASAPIRLTRAEVLALGPCDKNRIPKFGRRKSMSASEALDAGASMDDLLWVAGRLGRKDLCVRFALACAQRVAHLNPDPRVHAALDAASAWLAEPSEDNGAAARAAARDAARDAAGAAAGDAAWAASWAAWAASWAAGAAAGAAARVASWAARAAAGDAAWAAEHEAQRAIFKEIFG